jgi:hypothetical protein
VPASQTTLTLGAVNTSTPSVPPSRTTTTTQTSGQSSSPFEVAAKSSVGANDSALLAVLVLGFTIAVSGVVLVAGRRGGRRTR